MKPKSCPKCGEQEKIKPFISFNFNVYIGCLSCGYESKCVAPTTITNVIAKKSGWGVEEGKQ